MTASVCGILFTDIEGSVGKWDMFPDQMAAAFTRHNALIDSIVAAHGGQIRDRAGDGVLVEFADGNPLACALEIQSSFRREDWSPVAGLSLRMSVHAADNSSGAHLQPTINCAARMVGAAWGGQIVVSALAAASYSTPPGARLKDLGSARLRDIAAPVRLLCLTGADWVEETFPPLRGVERQTPNLPLQSTPIFGRQRDLQNLITRIKGEKGVVTIVGAGGIGKTRLASELARAISAEREVCFLVLPVGRTDTDRLIEALIAALRLPQRAGAAPRDVLLGYLRARDLMIVIDNADGVGDVADFVEAIRATCAQVSLVVTSRRNMGWRDETTYRLEGLSSSCDGGDFTSSPAAMLLAQSARAHDPSFAFDASDAGPLDVICNAVRGSPLALQLMAQWLPIMSLREISVKLATGQTRITEIDDALGALRNVFNGSWELLDSDQREALTALSVFPADFDHAAATDVAGVSQKLMLALERRSLIERRANHRLALHPVTREFAAEHLVSPRRETLLDLHARYYAKQVEEAAQAMRGPEAQKTCERVRAELANIRAMWTWLAQQKLSLAEATRIGESTFYLFALSGLFAEGLSLFETIPTGPRLRAAFLAYRGNYLFHVGRSDEAAAACGEALALATPEEKAISAHAHQGLANVFHGRAAWSEAHRHYLSALALRADDRMGRTYTTIALAWLEARRDRLREAEDWIAEGEALCISLGFTFGMFLVRHFRGELEDRRGHRSGALIAYRAALLLEGEFNNFGELGVVYAKVGQCERDLGDREAARASFEHALDLAATSGDERLRVRALIGLATLGDRSPDERRALFSQALRKSFEARSALDVSQALLEGARFEAKQSNLTYARRLYLAARALNVESVADFESELADASVDVSAHDSDQDVWTLVEAMVAGQPALVPRTDAQ